MDMYAVRIFVDDLSVARRFYSHTLGLKESWAMLDVGAIGYSTGHMNLIIEEEELDGEDGHLIGRFAGVSFGVENVERAYKEFFDKGVHMAGPPVIQAWGGLLAHFRDPAGNMLTLVEAPQRL